MNRGTQIAYIPTHAEGNLQHPDVEFGFVTSQRDSAYFCRYYRQGHLGDLRTKSCSELTPDDCLVEYVSVAQEVVAQALAEIEADHEKMKSLFQERAKETT